MEKLMKVCEFFALIPAVILIVGLALLFLASVSFIYGTILFAVAHFVFGADVNSESLKIILIIVSVVLAMPTSIGLYRVKDNLI